MRDSVHERCRGRWQGILMQMGVDPKFLRNRHGPCPFCGGKDRFRFDDKNGSGSFFCNSCGAGNGVDFVMSLKSCNFMEAVKIIEAMIGGSRLDVRRRSDPNDGYQPPAAPDISELANKNRELWGKSLELTGKDVASRYLIARGLVLKAWPTALRWVRAIPYWLDRELIGDFPALIARFIAADDSRSILQRTYLEEPGRKANVAEARKMMPGPIPLGGAVRLFAPAEVMGVAEGVETALAASLLHRDMPVWATLSTASILKFEPPPICKKLIIFEDMDEKKGGPAAAWALGHRLETRKRNPIETEVRVPGSAMVSRPWLSTKRDWNDVLWEHRHPGVS